MFEINTLWQSPIIKTLRRLSRDRPLFLVGGALRDALLHRDIKDVDVATGDDPQRCAQAFAATCDGSVVPLDMKQGVFRVVSKDQGTEGGLVITDFTRFKGQNIEEDLKARDFTINAMAMDLSLNHPVLFDPLKGEHDLKKKLIQECSPTALYDDPLRILRAYRLKGTLGFTMDKALVQRCEKNAKALASCASERKRDELFFLLNTENAHPIICDMAKQGVLKQIFPQIEPMNNTMQNDFHHLNVWEHSLESLKFLEIFLKDLKSLFPNHASFMTKALSKQIVQDRSQKALLKLATLFHDVGKPYTAFTKPNNERSFYGHDRKGASESISICRALALSRREEALVANLIKHHMRLLHLLHVETVSKRAILRLIRDCEDFLGALLLLSLADISATRGPKSAPDDIESMLSLINHVLSLYHECYLPMLQRKPLLTGHDIMTIFKIPQGPVIGSLLKRLNMAQWEGKVQDREQAISFISLFLDSKDQNLIS